MTPPLSEGPHELEEISTKPRECERAFASRVSVRLQSSNSTPIKSASIAAPVTPVPSLPMAAATPADDVPW